MFKNTLFIKLVCGVTIYSFSLAMIPQNVKAWGLPPESFNKMYSLAQRGDVEALRASVYRGLNIDSVNRNGDTGLCIAAKRRDTYTYNAFRASGANPRHPCTQRIVGYDDFVQRSSAVPMTANSREAYSAMGREQYRVAPWVWWAGGGLLIGGVVLALALGGGGGGGHGGSSEEKEPYYSLGAFAGTKAIINKTVNTDTINDKVISHTNSNTEAISNIDFNTNVLKNSEYLDVILKADKGATYTNAADTLLSVGAGTIAMDAVAKSKIINNGYININTNVASIGMVASESSIAINNGNSLSSTTSTNGIEMRFSGIKESDTLIGMYADTNSGISNNGEIRGSAILGSGSTSTAIAGSMIGMEGMIINVGKNLSQDAITLINTDRAKIELSAGDGSAGSETNVAIELVGMGSYLDYDFLNASKSINRAEKVLIRNSGDIDLSYTGNYTSSSSTALRRGLGGVVGVRADANTTAINDGDITIKLNDNGNGEAVNVAAGMQSVHGGKITNNQNISVTSPSSNNRINYGMLSVEGSGTVSALYTSLIPALVNSTGAVITMEVSNSYGMASFNSGSLTNDGRIILGNADDTTTQYTNNIAMYANGVRAPYASLINNGYIDIYSYKSMAMQNDFGGATPIINNGTIHVYRDAVDAVIFGGAYSQVINQNAIIYEATPSDDLDPTTPSSDIANPFVNYKPIIGIATMNTKPRTLGNEIVTSSSTTERILNDENATITIRDASFVSGIQVDTEQGIGVNKGIITIENRNLEEVDNVTNNIGMYLTQETKDNAYITNSGTISANTDFAAAMASDSTGNASMLNEKTGNITSTFKRSIGMYAAGRTIVRNAGSIDMKGNENTAIYADGNIDIRNQSTGVINVGAADTDEKDNSISTGYGIFSTAESTSNIENEGEINVYTNTRGAGIYTLGSDTVKNKQNINVYTDDTNGIHIGGKAVVTNSGTITVGTADKGVQNSHAIYVAETSEGSTVTNSGIIDFYNDDSGAALHGYAIYSDGDAEISNSGEINLHNANSTAIYAKGGSIDNSAILNILHDNSWALEIDEDADATNSAGGIINVGTKDTPVDGSYGILSNENSTGKITNDGTINVYNKSDDTYGIYAKGTTEVSNTKYITAFNDDGTAVYATGTNKITNSGEIKALGNNGYAVRSNPEKDDEEADDKTLTLTNLATGKLILGQKNQQKIGGAAVKAKAIVSILNNGEISVYNNNAIGIDTESGTSITNANSINVFGSSGIGISSGKVDKVTNSGSITLSHTTSTGNVGIQAISGTSIENTDTGVINISGYEGKAINATGAVETVTNKGKINVTTINDGGYEGTTSGIGINVADTTTLDNTGDITIESQEGVAINSTNSAQKINITNNANLTLNTTTNGVGIQVRSGAGIDNQEKGIITITGAKGKGINVTDTVTTVTNAAQINISNTEGGSVGIDVSDGTTLANSGAISIQGKQSMGILSDTVANISNNAAITLDNSNSQGGVGILATNGTSLNNLSKGVITISGLQGKGISVTQTMGTTSNAANITLTNSGGNSIGIDVAAGNSLTNSGTITISNKNGIGISSGTVTDITNTKTGSIKLANSNGGSTGILSSGSGSASSGSLTNAATIEINGKNGIGIDVTGGEGTLTNNGDITILNTSGTDSLGIRAVNGSTFSNTGNITIGGNSATGIGLSGNWSSSISNSGKISLTNTGGGSTAISAQGSGSATSGSFSNTGVIDIKGANSTGINILGSIGTITNSSAGTITLNNSSGTGYGIRAVNGATFNNAADITIGGSTATGIGLSGAWSSGVTNSGKISLTNTAGNSIGIQATRGAGTLTNEGEITITGRHATGIASGDMANVINTETGIITLNNSDGGSIGILAGQGTSLSNSGNITINNGQGIGIQADIMNITNNASISLSGNNANSKGIEITGSGDVTTSSKSIITLGKAGSSATGNYGIYTASGNIANGGNINMHSVGTAMYSNGVNSTLSNSGTITLDKNASYGMYARSGNLTNSKTITAAGSGSYGMYTSNTGTFYNTNMITMSGGGSYAMYAGGNGTFTNDGGSIIMNGDNSRAMYTGGVGTFLNQGSINITGNNSYGMYASSSNTISNGGGAEIIMSGTGNTAIYAGSSAENIINSGTIKVGNNSVGIRATDPKNISNTGDITVGNNSKGIYITVTSAANPVNIVNSKAITIGTNSYGIYIEKNYKLKQEEDEEGQMVYVPDATTVSTPDETSPALHYVCLKGEPCVYTGNLNSPASASRTIWLNDEEEEKQASSLIMMSSGLGANVRLLNSGTITTANAIDFGTGVENGDTENVLAAGGQYVAESFTGQITADSSIVENGFENTYTQKDAFVGEDKGVEVVSNSYMFDASTQENNIGNTDVVMTKKSLKTIIDDADVANYLEANYTAQKGANTFKSLKLMSTRASLNNAVNQTLGLGILPNIASQNMETEHLINRAVDDDVLTPSNEDVRARVNTMYLGGKADDKGQLSGYDEHTVSTYGFVDAKADMYARGGLGLYVARTHSKYNDGSSRYNNSMEMFVPLTYHRGGVSAMFKPKGGFGHGHFRRQGLDKRFKGDTTEYYYGADTLARYTFDFGGVEIAPTAGLSLTGMHMEGYQESQGGLKVDGGSVFSTKSILGADVSKTFAIDEHQALKLTAGGRYYHEFGERYHTTANVEDMAGKYDITDERLQRNSGLLRLKTQYNYKQFTVGAEATAPLKNNTDPYYYLNMGYWF